MRNRRAMVVLLALLAALVLAAAGCGGDEGGSAGDETGSSEANGAPPLPEVTALTSSACTDIEYEGEGDPDVLIASDMVLQGSSRTQTLQIVEAIRQVLDSAGWKAGAVNVGFQSCDDSTAQLGKWDPGKCSPVSYTHLTLPTIYSV